MREGWKCPACSRILGPHVDVCPCSEDGPGAGVTVPPSPVTPENDLAAQLGELRSRFRVAATASESALPELERMLRRAMRSEIEYGVTSALNGMARQSRAAAARTAR